MTSAPQVLVPLSDEKYVIPETVICEALNEGLKQVFIIGITWDNTYVYGSSTDDHLKNLSMLTEGLTVIRDYEASKR